jgi:hypothetical protein
MPQLIPLPKIRRFVAQDLKISRWEDVQPYFEQLLAQEVNTLPALQNWLQQRSELESVLDEDLAWRYIRMTCDTANEAHRQAYELFIGEIFPQMAPYDDQLNRHSGLSALAGATSSTTPPPTKSAPAPIHAKRRQNRCESSTAATAAAVTAVLPESAPERCRARIGRRTPTTVTP